MALDIPSPQGEARSRSLGLCSVLAQRNLMTSPAWQVPRPHALPPKRSEAQTARLHPPSSAHLALQRVFSLIHLRFPCAVCPGLEFFLAA